ncbi:borneol dehydrogenase, mitochondrial-like [Lycium ferocissimum]|uniref:borneol dehydrogenase, mitochondrial-like n=1 Tax=Lycium ferocissimum TaxID=112874 RepID=UPI0028168634|nr:borneol dehydrogenase, mitochondrial-like [Lycium ferocissimum]
MAVNFARRLEGKVAIITRAASGIGEAAARLFSKHGAKVVIADIQDDLALKVCKDLDPSSTTVVHCDVTKEEDLENAVNTIVSKYGKLDIMYNNAGIAGEVKSNILDNEKYEFEKVISINLIGTFLVMKQAARVMVPRGQGSIISTTSVCASLGGVCPHAYTSSKHGILGLTRNAAVNLGRYGIRVNCVSPYVVPTAAAFDTLKKMGKEGSHVYSTLNGAKLTRNDVAETVVFLASDESKYVSGQDFIFVGGYTIENPGLSMFNRFLSSSKMINVDNKIQSHLKNYIHQIKQLMNQRRIQVGNCYREVRFIAIILANIGVLTKIERLFTRAITLTRMAKALLKNDQYSYVQFRIKSKKGYFTFDNG